MCVCVCVCIYIYIYYLNFFKTEFALYFIFQLNDRRMDGMQYRNVFVIQKPVEHIQQEVALTVVEYVFIILK